MQQSKNSLWRVGCKKSTFNKAIQHIVEHLITVYGFRVTSEKIPQNKYQKYKLDFYLFLSRINKKIFNFFNSNFPVRYGPNLIFYSFSTATGYDGIRSIWFRKVINIPSDDGGWEVAKSSSLRNMEYFEVEIRPYPPEPTIHMSDPKKIFITKSSNNFSVSIYFTKTDNFLKFPINSETGIQSIDAYFSDYSDLKQCMRDYKLGNIGI